MDVVLLILIASFLSCVLGILIGSVLTAAALTDRVVDMERLHRRELIESLEEAVRE